VDGNLWVMWPVAGWVPSRRPVVATVAPPAAVLAAGRYTSRIGSSFTSSRLVRNVHKDGGSDLKNHAKYIGLQLFGRDMDYASTLSTFTLELTVQGKNQMPVY
ncbi:hypothetical protein ACLOJK_018766, partial [Asimina triloba]